MNDVEALKTAARLEQLGIVIRSADLRYAAESHRTFALTGGNRSMRRARRRATRKRGRR